MRICLLVATLAVLTSPVVADVSEEVNALMDHLKYGTTDNRVVAAMLLGYSNDSRVVDPLIEALNDEETLVRYWAVFSLGNAGDPKAVDPLINLLQDETYILVRGQIAETLGKLNDTRAIPELESIVNNNIDPYSVKASSYGALVKLGQTEYLPFVIEALTNEDETVRTNAALDLGDIADPTTVDPLIKALRDEEYLVRGSAAVALGNIGDPKAIDALTYMAKNDENEANRVSAEEALEAINATST
ncbi:MAG TPA: HEAT repeat domain-containing protein [Methanothrix sp.]|jgi:HEAT repeat protein|nr:HEAT repeat domain-containing protein [Methanothrix sp.]